MRNFSSLMIWVVICFFLLTSISCGNGTDDDKDGSPPDAPNLDSVQAVSPTEIDLQWSTWDSEAKGFRIARQAETESQLTVIATVHSAITTYRDTGLTPETRYYYAVQAFNKDGKSDYSGMDSDTTYFDGYGLCAAKNYWYTCAPAICGNDIQAVGETDTATGTSVFSCLGKPLMTATTMNLTFAYYASAGSCYNQPKLTVKAGTQSASFSFACQLNTWQEVALAIAIPAGTTLYDISFQLSSGDWGSQVIIKDITFSP